MCWKAEYIILILVSASIDYVAGIALARTHDQRQRNLLLTVSMASNLGILFFFKYWNFFSDNVRTVFQAYNLLDDFPVFHLLLPVGISFYTFQSMSYTIDIYRRQLEPERHFGRFMLFVMYFPQLVAGPIERAPNLVPQLRQHMAFDADRIVKGAQQMIWGFVKKIVIADRMAAFVNVAYADPSTQNGVTLLAATYFFTFQIYCDFSGYSDIAIGAARIMGHDLMDNFRVPYTSASIREFWSRWHISLSTWFKDYLYIPLGGNRVPFWRWQFNLLAVFLISGLWHGANWTFVCWGAIHGVYQLIGNWLDTRRLSKPDWLPAGILRWIQTAVTFHLVVISWVLFRANTLADAGSVLKAIVTLPLTFQPGMIADTLKLGGSGTWLVSVLLLVIFALGDPWVDRHIKQLRHGQAFPGSRWAFAGMVALLLVAGFFGEVSFIYFQF
jgi:D-alanyl-lipoteichoic acid acyltransferase DltB (MBOAT superfamily)